MQTEKSKGIGGFVKVGLKRFLSNRYGLGVIVLIIIFIGGYAALFYVGKSKDNHKKSQAHSQEQKKPGGDIKVKSVTSKKNHNEKPQPVPSRETATAKNHRQATQNLIGRPVTGRVVPAGVTFVRAALEPLKKELDRSYGWRPNDIIEFTDNVNNFQLGVLEVTRRTAEVLAEKLSRPGAAASFDKDLERARSRFMNQADSWWFPSAESEYRSGIKELEAFAGKLEKGEAGFYTRTDNLIPLLAAYEQLLGSCDENLVKEYEENGRHVSFFKADDYFYQAQGVASAIHTILEAVQKDFAHTINTRDGIYSLERAINECGYAMHVHPWIILDCGMNSMFANHRSNLAGAISHARFYIGLLIETLST